MEENKEVQQNTSPVNNEDSVRVLSEFVGHKMNMSQVFSPGGKVIPVTLIKTNESLSQDLVDELVELTGISKGKGFTGVMKKWNFKGGPATRGQSDKPRAPGSIGSQTPGRVYKGKKMAGRHGNRRVTLKNSKIVQIDEEKKLLMVTGPVPGSRNSEVLIRIKQK